MSEQDKTKKDSGSKSSNDVAVYFMICWLPIMMGMMVVLNNSEHEHEMLTDAQILERQAEAEAKKLEKEQEWQKTVNDFDSKFDQIVTEAPFPFNFIVGIGVMFVFYKGFSSHEVRRMRFGRMFSIDGFLNPNFLIPLIIGAFYVLWVSGDLDMINLVRYDQ